MVAASIMRAAPGSWRLGRQWFRGDGAGFTTGNTRLALGSREALSRAFVGSDGNSDSYLDLADGLQFGW